MSNPTDGLALHTSDHHGEERQDYGAVVSVERPEQLEELVRLAADAEIGLAIEAEPIGVHIEQVHVVEVSDRQDGVYVFGGEMEARRFATVVQQGGGDCAVQETPINFGEGAGRLTAAERGDVLEDMGWPRVAEDVREGMPLERCLTGLYEVGERRSDAAELLRCWIGEDE